MALTQVTGPYPIFTDLDGTPLDDGYLYIGAINDDPETNPIQVFWDSALTIPATQPIRTSNGYAYRNGSPALIYTGGAFSITIRNKREEFVLYSPVGYGFDPAAVSASVVKNDFIGNGVQVAFVLSASPSTKLATNVFINGVYQEKDSYSLSGNTITFSIAPPLSSSIEILTNETGVINGGNANDISYTLTAPGATLQSVQTKLEQYVSVKDFGAVGDGVTDDLAAFEDAANSDTITQVLIPAGSYYLSAVLTTTGSVTWVVDRNVTFTGTDILRYIQPNRIVSFGGYRSIESDPAFYNGIFGYLEQNASLSGYANIGIHGSARSFGGAGTAGEADIGIAAFGYNDIIGGFQGVWGLYSTVMRASGVLGATHGMEIDVANMGATVPIWPATPFMQGLTSGAWICSGGESTEPSAGGSPGAASVGIAIIRNDSQVVKTASFEKGIVFHNNAILGTDGATGIGIAIAFATGHSMQWYNNSNQLCAEIVATGRTLANTGFRMDFTDTGIRFEDRITGAFSLAITKPAVPANGLSIAGSEAGSPIIVSAQGSDTNIDLVIAAKGTGVLDFRNIAFAGSAGSSAGYLPVKVNGVSYKIQLFNV
jgi:hypothetical protein